MKNLERLEYDIEVVTPMFLGGADKNAELRIPSIKGMLRFWWRATCEYEKIEDMKKKEDEIFGSTEQKSKVIIRIKNIKFNSNFCSQKFSFPIKYLAFGAIVGKKVLRNYIPPQTKFKLVIFFPSKYTKDIEIALKYLINIGGLGSKSRNGFGSLYCKKLIVRDLKIRYDNIRCRDYTALSSKSNIIKFSPKSTWQEALKKVGEVYMEARKKIKLSQRCFIGKPIITGDLERCTGDKEVRHSKPYFIHINKLPNGEYQSQIAFIPYNYNHHGSKEKYFEILYRMNQYIEKISGSRWKYEI